TLLVEHLDVSNEIFEPIIASPKYYHYRNRLDLKLKRTRDYGILIGFTPIEARKSVLPIDTCFIADKHIDAFIPQVKKEALAKLPEKYRMANLTIRTGDDGRTYWGGIGRRSTQLEEKDYLWTQIRGRKIFYSLDTFFQANLSILPELFNRLIAFDFWGPNTILYDLYGGVGLFSIGLIDNIQEAILIEENISSIKLAEYNKQFHKLDNLKILSGKVEDEFPKLLKKNKKSSQVVMIDPPRAGLSENAIDLILSAENINYILYLSCHPESLARDLKIFIDNNWKVQTIIPLDFFPRTKHIETLVLLQEESS
ncbi:RNA methyltransferase, TrmA family, partial [hydrothermal vent metagenome]